MLFWTLFLQAAVFIFVVTLIGAVLSNAFGRKAATQA